MVRRRALKRENVLIQTGRGGEIHFTVVQNGREEGPLPLRGGHCAKNVKKGRSEKGDFPFFANLERTCISFWGASSAAKRDNEEEESFCNSVGGGGEMAAPSIYCIASPLPRPGHNIKW